MKCYLYCQQLYLEYVAFDNATKVKNIVRHGKKKGKVAEWETLEEDKLYSSDIREIHHLILSLLLIANEMMMMKCSHFCC